MYIALWTEEVYVANPYYEQHGYNGEPAMITETRQKFEQFPTLEAFQRFVINNQNKQNMIFYSGEMIKPKINVTVEVTV